MPPIESLMILSTASLTGLAMLAGAAAWGWSAWLKLRKHELEQGGAALRGRAQDLPAIGARIDIADLKERIKKLEAIAAGVDF